MDLAKFTLKLELKITRNYLHPKIVVKLVSKFLFHFNLLVGKVVRTDRLYSA